MVGIAMLLLCSCDAENSISKYPCQFYFMSQYHPGTSLETALNGTGTYTDTEIGRASCRERV